MGRSKVKVLANGGHDDPPYLLALHLDVLTVAGVPHSTLLLQVPSIAHRGVPPILRFREHSIISLPRSNRHPPTVLAVSSSRLNSATVEQPSTAGYCRSGAYIFFSVSWNFSVRYWLPPVLSHSSL